MENESRLEAFERMLKVVQENYRTADEKMKQLKAEGKEITLAVIQVGNDPASTVYVGNKKKSCE